MVEGWTGWGKGNYRVREDNTSPPSKILVLPQSPEGLKLHSPQLPTVGEKARTHLHIKGLKPEKETEKV